MRFDAKTAEAYATSVMQRKMAVELNPSLQIIAEEQARKNHEAWREDKESKGYVYGEKTNDDPTKGPLTNPLLVDFDDLSESDKRMNMANAVAVIQILRDRKCKFVNFRKFILEPIAEQIHDEWCREKLSQGWKWGPETDKGAKIHRDLVPFKVLLKTPGLEQDVDYDISTAKKVILELMDEENIFPVVTDLLELVAMLA